jgi:hypothetical protein
MPSRTSVQDRWRYPSDTNLQGRIAVMSSDAFEFDVALSYAGEDRSLVEKVAKVLREANIRMFYDEYFTTEMWGEDLYVYLDAVYQTRSKFVAIFVSRAYAAKPWTNHERQSAQARALKERSAYILPIGLDNADIPGLRPTIGFLEAQGISGEQIAAMIMKNWTRVPEGRLSLGHQFEPSRGPPSS